jgi:DNA-directed RNA polymerase subunit D
VVSLKIRIISKKGETLKFMLEGATPAFANTLRRIMISEVPTLAIEDVDFHDNSSALFDEVVAHRLGCIPLKFDPKKFNFSEECKCGGKGCPLCQVVFYLEKSGPCVVYSKDLKSSNREVKPTSPDFPIVKLLKGQNIKLEAIAKLGIGRNHAKWQAANASYQYFPMLEIKKGFKNLKSVVDSCPKGVLAIKNRKLVLVDPFRADECRMAEEVSDGNVIVRSDPTKLLFKVESISGLDPKYILSESANILEGKAKEFMDLVKKDLT